MTHKHEDQTRVRWTRPRWAETGKHVKLKQSTLSLQQNEDTGETETVIFEAGEIGLIVSSWRLSELYPYVSVQFPRQGQLLRKIELNIAELVPHDPNQLQLPTHDRASS